jgi:Phage major capsid protein E
MSTIALPSMFEAAELTNVLDLMQIQYGTITQMGMFPFMGMATRYAAIRRSEQGLCLVPAAEWCGPPRAANKRKKTDMIFIEVPHTPIIDVVHPCDVMGRPTYDLNTPMGLKTMADEVNERMASMRAKLEITAFVHCSAKSLTPTARSSTTCTRTSATRLPTSPGRCRTRTSTCRPLA